MSRILLACSILLILAPPAAASSAEGGVCASALDEADPRRSCCGDGTVQLRVKTKCVIVKPAGTYASASSEGDSPAAAKFPGPCAQVSWEPRDACGLRGCHGRVVVALERVCLVYIGHGSSAQAGQEGGAVSFSLR